jgi:hypothetical protein
MERIVAVLFLLMPALSVAEKGFPEVCTQVYGAAADAADAAASRDTKTMAAMKKAVAPRTSIAKLPPDEGELLRSLNDIVEEHAQLQELRLLKVRFARQRNRCVNTCDGRARTRKRSVAPCFMVESGSTFGGSGGSYGRDLRFCHCIRGHS